MLSGEEKKTYLVPCSLTPEVRRQAATVPVMSPILLHTERHSCLRTENRLPESIRQSSLD